MQNTGNHFELISWNTTDGEEIQKRKLRAQNQQFEVVSIEESQKLFSSFLVGHEDSDNRYLVEIRSLKELQNSCECLDFQTGGLGTCKHIEAVLLEIKKTSPQIFQSSFDLSSPRFEIFLDRITANQVRVARPPAISKDASQLIDAYFTADGFLRTDPLSAMSSLKKELKTAATNITSSIRLSSEVDLFLKSLAKEKDRSRAQEKFIAQLNTGEASAQVLNQTLLPYQIEGLIHLAFKGRAILADEMGMGKSLQALAAAELLKKLHKTARTLIITNPAKKMTWMNRVKDLTSQTVVGLFGTRNERISQLRRDAVYFIASHGEIREDFREISRLLSPQLIILDEIGSVRDWQTQTSQAIRHIAAEFLFILSNRIIENRLDDLYSLFQLIDSSVFGPLFRFNRAYCEFDSQGSPIGYKNLDALHEKIRPFILRRLRSDVASPGSKILEKTIWVSLPESFHKQTAKIYHECAAKIKEFVAPRIPKEERSFLQKNIQLLRKHCAIPVNSGASSHAKVSELRDFLKNFDEPQKHQILILVEWEIEREILANAMQGLGFAVNAAPGDKLVHAPGTITLATANQFLQNQCCYFDTVICPHVPVTPSLADIRHFLLEASDLPNPPLLVCFVAKGSIEQRLFELEREKTGLIDWVLDGTTPHSQNLTWAVTEVNHLKRLLGLTSSTSLNAQMFKEASVQLQLNAEQEKNLKTFVFAQITHQVLFVARIGHANKPLQLLVINRGSEEKTMSKFCRKIDEYCHRSKLPKVSITLLDQEQLACMGALLKENVFSCTIQPDDIWYARKEEPFLRTFLGNTSGELNLTELKSRALVSSLKQLKLAAHLLKGDFTAEAILPLAAAANDVLKVAAYSQPRSSAEMAMLEQNKDVPLSFILSKLIPEKGISENFIASITKIHTWALNPEIASSAQIHSQIEEIKKLLDP